MAKRRATNPRWFYPTPKQVFGTLLLLLFGYAIFRAGQYVAFQTTFFEIRQIKVAGTHYRQVEDILNLANVEINRPLYDAALPEITQRILRDPYIQGASVRRELPSTLLIEVQEREPAFYLTDKILFMVDRSGKVLKRLPNMRMVGKPLVTGVRAADLETDTLRVEKTLRLISQIAEVDDALFTIISEIDIANIDNPRLFLVNGGAQVELGKHQYYTRLYILSEFLNRQQIFAQLSEIKKIDLTFEDRVVVRKKT